MPKTVNISHSREITERWLFAIDRIMGNRSNGKVTQQRLGDELGISSSNINRLRNDQERNVTLEACARICSIYKISPYWLLLGEGELYSNSELFSAYEALEKRLSEAEKSLVSIEREQEKIKKKLKI